jgi:hypothetical protein
MQDVYDLVRNIEGVYGSNTAFQVLKDFERVIDELDIYVYKNWEDGELAEGPVIDRHWITCTFMWPKGKMPDPMGGKRLTDYDCKVKYQETYVVVPRKIRKPGDMRPGTKKGKLDKKSIWLVEIQMPKSLVMDIYSGYKDMVDFETEPAVDASAQGETEMQPADQAMADAPDEVAAGMAV